ncbi:hypothetical protein ACEPAG_1308 [Sanghuangporus baumii]
MSDGRQRRRADIREPLEANQRTTSSQSSSTGAHFQAVSRAILAPFRRKADSNNLLTELAPVLMTPKMISSAASSSSKSRGSLGATDGRMDIAALGRAPLRFGLGTRRITSTDLQVAEANVELLNEDVPEPVGVASDVSLLRGFKATIPSAERGKSRRHQMRNVNTVHIGLKKLGTNARGLLAEDAYHGHESGSDDDVVMVDAHPKKRRGRRTRESLGASVALGKEELRRQEQEILLDKENIHVRRTLKLAEISEITAKIDSLEAIRSQLESDLLKLKEDELELDDELEGVRERKAIEEPNGQAKHVDQSSRRRKGPVFLPSEHDDLPPGVAFLTLPVSSQNAPIAALDFSEPYGTLVSAASESDDDPSPRVWDMLEIEEIGRLQGHRGPVRALQVEDHVCLTGGEDGALRVWDLRRVGDQDGELINLADIREEQDDDSATSSIRNGTGNGSIVSGTDGPCARVLEGHSKAISALYFEENCLVSGASDKTLRQWDLTTGQCVMTMDILWAISHPSGASMSASTSGLLPGAASVIGNFAVPMPPRSDGSWDMYQDFIGAVQFWGYGLVSGSGDGVVRMWDMRTGQAHRTLLGHTAPVTCLQFDQLHIVTGSLDKSIRIWDIRTGGITDTIKFEHGVTALQFDTRKVVAAAGENAVKIYNRTTMQVSSLITNGHTRPVERLRYMDRYLATGGLDSTVKIWAL